MSDRLIERVRLAGIPTHRDANDPADWTPYVAYIGVRSVKGKKRGVADYSTLAFTQKRARDYVREKEDKADWNAPQHSWAWCKAQGWTIRRIFITEPW